MTDKVQKIRQKIERLEAYPQSRGFIKHMIAFIDSLPEESASEDLEEEIKKLDNWYPVEIQYIREIAHHFAEWQKQRDDKHIGDLQWEAYLKGEQETKQQMVKNTVLETKVIIDCDGDGIETPYEEWLTLENTEIPYIPDELGLKEGDKVKIVIIKSEQQ